MLAGDRLGTSGGGGRDMNRMIGIPNTPKNTEKPPHISTEIRAQFLRRMRPIPVTMPKTERQTRKAKKANVALLTKAGSSGTASWVVPSKMPKKPRDIMRSVINPAKMAKTAATITEAEAGVFKALTI
jgi:hypothetical protein